MTFHEKSSGKRRIWTFRTLAILSGFLLLAILEIALRIAGFTPSPDVQDPYISFEDNPVLFVKDDSGEYYQTAENRLAFFREQRFPVEKSPDAFRIFVLGGSTVQGRPYSVKTAFPAWLKINLEAAQPDRKFEVINCGGVSYASYRLIPIMKEILEYEPDLFILYTGHNEFLEERSYGRIKDAPPIVKNLMKIRTVALFRKIMFAGKEDSTPENGKLTLPAEVDARLDYEDGLENFEREPELRNDIISHFESNVEEMILMSEEAGVPLILVNPVSNLKDSPPFKSAFRKSMSEQERTKVNSLWKEAEEIDWDRNAEKIALLEKALELNPKHAELFFSTGKAYERMGRFDEAKENFIQAKDADIAPLRILEPMHHVLIDLSREHDIIFVDARELFEEKSPGGIPGDEMLLDHVHPDIEGHQIIADAIFEKLIEKNFFQAPENWKEAQNRLRKRHLESLDEVYFQKGAMRHQRLKEWSRGRIPEDARIIQD